MFLSFQSLRLSLINFGFLSFLTTPSFGARAEAEPKISIFVFYLALHFLNMYNETYKKFLHE